MKHLLLTLALTIPSLSFACINLSGTYSQCVSDYSGNDQIREVRVDQSTPKISLEVSYDLLNISAEFLLDGVSRTVSFDLEGTPATMTTTASCDASGVAVNFVLEHNSQRSENGYELSKNAAGSLVITESLSGEYSRQTICEANN